MRTETNQALFGSDLGNRLGYLLAVAAFAYVLFCLVIYAFPSLQEWQPLAFATIGKVAMRTPPFADLAMLTHSARCDGSLSDLFTGRVNCDPYGRLFTYPPMALWMFRYLGLSAASLGWVGLLLGGSVALITGAFFFALIPSAAVAGPLLALAYLSLPFQLVLERANNDLIVFLFLVLLALALSTARRFSAAAAAMAFLAVATKVLPVFGILATSVVLGGLGSRHPGRPGHLRWALLGGLAGLGLVLPWLASILKNSPAPPGGLLSHGLLAHQVCFQWMVDLSLSAGPSRALAYGCLLTKLAVLLAGVVGALRQRLPAGLRLFLASQTSRLDSGLVAASFCLFTGTWVGTYLFTRSYDYKFIFLLPALGLTGALLCRGGPGTNRRAWVGLVLVPMLSAWFLPYLAISFGLPLGNALELVNDFVLIPVLAGVLVTVLAGCRPSGRQDPAGATVGALDQ